jgi:putative ABC transport system ATP-binding protein
MDQPLIDVKNLSRVYGSGDARVTALADVDFQVGRGEFVSIMGPSGSGKSTLLNILGCLDRPTSGAYILDGRDVSGLSKNELAAVRNQKIGFVFQSFNLLPRLTALENVMLALLYNLKENLPAEARLRRARQALEAVGLGDRLHHRPNQLSGGQQQRAAIARALVNNPPLILADEPTGNLDSKSSEDVMALLAGLHAQGVTLVMVTHEAGLAARSQRVIRVKDGRVDGGTFGDNGRSIYTAEPALQALEGTRP